MKTFVASLLAARAFATVNLIIDTDAGFDVDDIGAVGEDDVLHPWAGQ